MREREVWGLKASLSVSGVARRLGELEWSEQESESRLGALTGHCKSEL